MNKFSFAAGVLLVAVFAGSVKLVSQPAQPVRVGPRDGGFLLVSGWMLRPAGRQLPLDTFPMSSVITPNGKYMLVLNQGYNPPSISVIDLKAEKELRRVPVPDGWLGMALTRNGRRLYVGGGSRASVYEFAVSEDAELTPARTFAAVPEADRKPQDFLGDVAFSPDERLLYVTDLYRDRILVINPQSGRVIEKYKTGKHPYRILFHPDGKSFFVTSWVEGTLYHHDASSGQVLSFLRLGPHTTDMVWREGMVKAEDGDEMPYKARIFVSAANTNRVFSVGVSEAKELRLLESINVSLTPQQPFGMTPSAVALSKDASRLYVVCSDANAVAVADIREARTRVLGFVPTAWYPMAARELEDGRLVVFNGRGPRSYPNPKGPSPAKTPAPSHQGERTDEYVGHIQRGTASFIDKFDEPALADHTRTVLGNTPYRDQFLEDANVPAGNPIPSKPGDPSPIQHVIYIVKENRTYDQVLGDIGKGESDPSLLLFGEKVSPNHHKLARDFVLFDNFYVSADVSADGHNWSTGAIAPDYVQKMWPNSYAGRRKLYDYEGTDPASRPPAGYIWTQVAAAGLTLRNYGYLTEQFPAAKPTGEEQIKSIRDTVLAPNTSLEYRAFDLDYPDVDRAKIFIGELDEMEKANALPRFIVMRLGNDHTSGLSGGKISPQSAVADNDYALGQIVEACSKSKYWSKMAIFVLEDDAQNGPDHIDSHRSPAFVISPYTRRGIVDSTLYNTTSVLRTMELILGLHPMTVFDAAARPMWTAFDAKADTRPWIAEKPRISLTERNPAQAPGTKSSARMDFREADRNDDGELNAVLWKAIRGSDPPAPVSSFFAR